MNIEWDDDAKTRLKEIILYGIETWGIKVAKQFQEKVIKAERRLSMNPEMGPPEPLLANRLFEYRGIIIQKNFKLIYRIDKEKDFILILDVWDTRREPKTLAGRIE